MEPEARDDPRVRRTDTAAGPFIGAARLASGSIRALWQVGRVRCSLHKVEIVFNFLQA